VAGADVPGLVAAGQYPADRLMSERSITMIERVSLMAQPTVVISVNTSWNLVNFRESLLRSLVTAGYRVIALAPPDGCEKNLAALGVHYVPIALDGRGLSPIADIRTLLSYIRILRRIRPQVYLGFTVKPNVYGGIACRLLGIPRIANIAGLGTAFIRGGLLNRIVRQLYATGLKGAPCVFFQNRNDRDHFVTLHLADPDRAGLLPGSGVDLDRFQSTTRDKDGKTVFLLVSRLLWAKGIHEYVEAAKILRRRYGERVICRLLGIPDQSSGGVDRDTLQRWKAEADIELLDSVSDVRPILGQADCVVLPSYYPEGTPRSLLEAAGMGKAIITTDTPGCRDVVEEGGNGFLCEPRSLDSLVKAMDAYCRLDDQDRAKLAAASRGIAESRYDEQIVLRRYAEEISKLLPR
jgi:glycosyltransferase involved in cell wall biosynthesis